MSKKTFKAATIFIALLLLPVFGTSNRDKTEINSWRNDIPPRLQWNGNFGYCGEVSLISAGLYYGQYISQYDVRAIAIQNAPQNQGQLLIGVNDVYTASQMHLNSIEWDTDNESNTNDFLAWIKQNVVKGYPVIIGLYVNEYLFDGNSNPYAGDPDYDHIVPVIGIDSNRSFSDPDYRADDVLYFSDNGIWQVSGKTPYIYGYSFSSIQGSREKANNKNERIYSLSNDASNYGIAITGVTDLHGDTLPVRLTTNVNYENPPIVDGSATRPTPMPLELTITVSNLVPNVKYVLYRYNSITSVPDSNFNRNASQAYESWNIEISSGTTYVMTETIYSNEMAIYRAVKASAP